jgi:predicted component of type VI protein secretion system
MKELYRLLGIKLAATTAYHPQGNGQTERANQELEQYLHLFINQRQDDWVGLLLFAEFQYNNHIHSTTQQPPFLLDTSQMPHMGFKSSQQRSPVESINQFKEHQKQTLSPDYKPRDKVYLDTSKIQTN